MKEKTKRQNLKCYYLSFLDQTTIGSEGGKEEEYINLQRILYFKNYYASSLSLLQHTRLKYLGNYL